MSRKPVQYHEYLHLDKILSAQEPLSWKTERPSHDEMLFIITHQTYELWFKQALTEVDSILNIFDSSRVSEKDIGLCVLRLERMIEIFKLLVQHIDVLETMTPQDFLEFRGLLFPASGFQSFQFRTFENKMGLRSQDRLLYNQSPYHAHFSKPQGKALQEMESNTSLFMCIEKWLERTPFVKMQDFDFWSMYQKSVEAMFAEDKKLVDANDLLAAEDRQRNYAQIDQSRALFLSLFNEKEFDKVRDSGQWRLSLKAIRAALFIQIYRDQPLLHLPFRLIMTLMSIDETVTHWRYRHALMAKRMLGTKVGTGGSSGHEYLKQSTEQHRIFNDLFKLTTYLIPRHSIPDLPPHVAQTLGYSFKE